MENITFYNIDWKDYLNNYIDLKKNNIDSKEKCYNHWIKYGIKENRKCNIITLKKNNNKSNINIIGYFHYNFGVAKNAHNFHDLLDYHDIEHNIYNIDCCSHKKHNSDVLDYSYCDYSNSTNIFILVDENNIKKLINHVKNNFENCINIIYYVIEVKNQELNVIKYLDFFNKIFVNSQYCKDIISIKDKSVISVFPLVPIIPKFMKNIPYQSKIVLFYMCDTLSCIYRKNIYGFLSVVDFFSKYKNKYFFILKIINFTPSKELKNSDYYEINNLIIKLSKINLLVIDFFMLENELNKIMDICDIYLSMHRSEGFGYTLYEISQKNKYIISTNYSAPNEYLKNYSKFIPIKYTLIKTSNFKNSLYYNFDSEWCEPDINDCINKIKNILINKNIPNLILDVNNIKNLINI